MTTIKDVAKYAGVSITAVSYALNGTGTIAQATRQRVLQAAEILNYHPNAFARNLKKSKTHTIGVFISAFGGSFYEEILEGIHGAVLQTEYELIVCPDTRPARRILTHRQVDGAIVFDSRVKNETLLKLVSEKFPIIVMDRYLEADYLLPILIDNRQGVIDAFNHLYDQGIRRIDYITGAADSFDNAERVKAFSDEAAKKHVSINIYQGNFTEQSGYENANLMLNSNHLPEAVFCANDQMAIGFLRSMKEHNLRSPDDIAIVGFDDIPLSRYTQPTLSTVRVSRFLWGSSAATQLIDFLEFETPFQFQRIPTQLIPRESSLWQPRPSSGNPT